MDSFLYERDLHHKRVNKVVRNTKKLNISITEHDFSMKIDLEN